METDELSGSEFSNVTTRKRKERFIDSDEESEPLRKRRKRAFIESVSDYILIIFIYFFFLLATFQLTFHISI